MSACNTPPTASSSAFVSAAASPFFSPPVPSSTGSTPAALRSPPQEQAEQDEEERKDEEEQILPCRARKSAAATTPTVSVSKEQSLDSSRDGVQRLRCTTIAAAAAATVEEQAVEIVALSSAASSSAPLPLQLPPEATPSSSSLSSSSARPRSCDVFIGIHGHSSSLSRFSKWLRAELELQGIACYAADRARFTDSRSRDMSKSILRSCTFGVVIITKRSFRNLYSIEELRIFLQRKNLVPLFFDVAPTECLARDIVERRGEIWEKEGGELWKLFDGEEKEWTEAVNGLSRVEEWKLEAYSGNWRNCILKAVSLLGMRLGRRSVAEREKTRKERFEGEEFPFPRNPSFVGRDRELKLLECMLFTTTKISDDGLDFPQKSGRHRHSSRSYLLWEGRRSSAARHAMAPHHRRSDAERWQRRRPYMDSSTAAAALDDGPVVVARRKSDSDKMRDTGLVSGRFEPEASSSVSRLSAWDVYASASAVAQSSDIGGYGNSISGSRIRGSRRRRSLRHRQATAMTGYNREIQLHQNAGAEQQQACCSSNDGGGIACITGASGIGKTEMVLEYAYRYSQRYRMILWVGGEARYLRQNYLNLSLFLGLDVGTETQVGGGAEHRGSGGRSFDEHEVEAFERVKRELQRDVPYLLIIDNLESERDWWDGREISELIPRSGGATHVIFTTRLPKVMNLKSYSVMELSYLSGVDALSLMKGNRDFFSQEVEALRVIEEKLGRLTIGLGIVGKLLSELPIMPSELLDRINRAFLRDWAWGAKEETTLRNHPFLVKVLGVCFSLLDQNDGGGGGFKDLALRMACVGGWFAPFPIPVCLLALAASKYAESSATGSRKLLRKLGTALFCCCCASSQMKRWEAEAGQVLLRYGVARRCTRQGWVHFHEIVQLYARKIGGTQAAKAMVQGVRKRGAISLHCEHFWAACFLVLGFGNDPVVVELKVVDLLSFIRSGVLPLAVRSFTSFSRCYAALEFLRLCTSLLEHVEKSFVSQTSHDRCDKSLLCWMKRKKQHDGYVVDEYVWQDVTLLKALLLETRAKLMLKGGQVDAAEELCRTCISIRTVMLGQDHPDTVSVSETLAKLVRYKNNS